MVNGFRPLTKEITYQIVVNRSKGSRLWDIDGNEYVDVLNGFGMNLFGWRPDFINEALHAQLDQGYEIGPQHALTGEVSQLICELTGFDRVGLCNTGSEAVMAAMRIARTVTGRDTVVLFSGSYHGTFDEVLVRAGRDHRGMPAAPGILPGMFGEVRVLDYGTPESLEFIRANAGDLAAVLVETVQSRRPDFQPREFLREVRAITEAAGTCLIFDEVITGFRSHLRGIQAVFGIRADLATYGKVIGGGMPIGVVAGKREFMDALDGGPWQYGDDSIPTVGVTYFAGTFVRHPLALAAAKASLEHLKRAGPGLQEQLNLTTAAMADELTRLLSRGWRAARNPLLRFAVARHLARGPSAAGPAVRNDAQPRNPHPRQLPLLHDHRAQRAGHRADQVGVQGIGRRNAGSRFSAARGPKRLNPSTQPVRLSRALGSAAMPTASRLGSSPIRMRRAST